MGQGPRYPSYDKPYEQDYPAYDDQFSEPVDLDSFGSQLRSSHTTRSIATREQFLPDDSVPLFLANEDDDVRSPRFGRPQKTGSSRLLKTAAFVVAATVATFVAVKNPFTVFANATASLMGTQETKPAAAAVPAATPSTQAAVVAPSLPAIASTANAAPSAASTQPSRDDIAVALRTAHQTLAPSETPPPAPPAQVAAVTPTVAAVAPTVVASAPAAPPIRRLSADELANLMSRGKALLSSGDIASARLLLERAAEAGEASAALMVAQTYDPAVLGSQDTRNITADPAQARSWYQRAAQLGSTDAQRRLSQLQ